MVALGEGGGGESGGGGGVMCIPYGMLASRAQQTIQRQCHVTCHSDRLYAGSGGMAEGKLMPWMSRCHSNH